MGASREDDLAGLMAEIVNLNRARKTRDKVRAKAAAAANRAAFGRSKPEKAAEVREAERARRLLDGARREDGERRD